MVQKDTENIFFEPKIICRIYFRPKFIYQKIKFIKYFEDRIITIRAIEKDRITHKFFLNLFNKSFYIGDFVLFNIPNVEQFIEEQGDVFCKTPYVVLQLNTEFGLENRAITILDWRNLIVSAANKIESSKKCFTQKKRKKF